MKVTVERIDNHKTVLEIQVPQVEVTKAVDKAYHKLAAQVKVPGFRKGKAPRRVLESRIGKEAILDEAFDLIAPNAYTEALQESAIEPVSRPAIEVVTLNETEDLVFKATVVPKPEVTLGEYKNLEVPEVESVVADDAVENRLKEMQSRQAKMVVLEDGVLEKGDFAIIDFQGFVDGEAFQGGEGKGYPLEIGSGSFIPGFEDQLIGKKAGEEVTVQVTFPEEYFSKDLAGKPAEFKVKINDVKRKELPALDDEFAKDVSDFATLEELKSDIQNKLQETEAEKAAREFKNNVIKAAVDNASMDIPDVMIEDRINLMIQDLAVNLENRGMKLAQYMEFMKLDMNGLRQNYREMALANIKVDLLLEAVAKAEGFEVAAEDLNAEIEAMATTYGAKPEEIKKIIEEQDNLGALEKTVLRKKAMDLIFNTAVKTTAVK